MIENIASLDIELSAEDLEELQREGKSLSF